MEQLDPEDGQAVRDFAERCEVPLKPRHRATGGALRDLTRLESRPASPPRRTAPYWSSPMTATWPPSPTGSSPWPAPDPGTGQGATEVTELQ
jgi:hypothetical protein